MSIQNLLQALVQGGGQSMPPAPPMDVDPGMTPNGQDIWHILGITPQTVGNFPQAGPRGPQGPMPSALSASPMTLNVQGPGAQRPPALGMNNPNVTQPAAPSAPAQPGSAPPMDPSAAALQQLLQAYDQNATLQKKALAEQNTPMQGLAPRPGAEALAGLADILFGKSRGDILGSFNNSFAQARQGQNDQAQKKANTQAGSDQIDAQTAMQKAQANYAYQQQQQAAKTKSDTEKALEADKTARLDAKIQDEMSRAKTGADYRRLASGLSKDAQLDPAILDQDAKARDQQYVSTVLQPKYDASFKAKANIFGELRPSDEKDLRDSAASDEQAMGLAPGTIKVPISGETFRAQQAKLHQQDWAQNFKFKQTTDARNFKEKTKFDDQTAAKLQANLDLAHQRLKNLQASMQDAQMNADTARYSALVRAYNTQAKAGGAMAGNLNGKIDTQIGKVSSQIAKLQGEIASKNTPVDQLPSIKAALDGLTSQQAFLESQREDPNNWATMETSPMLQNQNLPGGPPNANPAAPATGAPQPPADGYQGGQAAPTQQRPGVAPVARGVANFTPPPAPKKLPPPSEMRKTYNNMSAKMSPEEQQNFKATFRAWYHIPF